MIEPVKLAKDNGLWPELTPLQTPDGPDADEVRAKWRDATRVKIKKLAKDYGAWAQSDKGVVGDPGPAPTPIEMPLTPPQPSDSEDKHKEFRRVTDLWFDTEYMTRYLPESETWAVASALWQQKLDTAHIAVLEKRRRSLRWMRFLSYIVAGMAACFAAVVLCSLFLPGYLPGIPGGLVAVLSVFLVDYGFNKLEDKLARAQVDVEAHRDRERETRLREERQRVLAKLGLPDDTAQGPGPTLG